MCIRDRYNIPSKICPHPIIISNMRVPHNYNTITLCHNTSNLTGYLPLRAMAVSYTHLDVYKRQVMHSVISDCLTLNSASATKQ